jgi:ribonucleotide reductase alpha subunit
MNTALWINDLFIKRVEEDGEWTLFCPSYASHLSELYGENFEKAYRKLEEKRDSLPLTRVVKAKDLWKKILKSLFSTSHPWPTFADNANIRYSNIHEGVLHGSNLCVVGDTQIVIRFGVEERIIQIKDLNFYLHTHPKVEVLSKDLDTGEQVFAEIAAFAQTGESKELIEIKDEETGKTLRCTPEHPVLTKNRGYVKAGELTGEDSLDVLI